MVVTLPPGGVNLFNGSSKFNLFVRDEVPTSMELSLERLVIGGSCNLKAKFSSCLYPGSGSAAGIGPCG